MIHVGSCLPRSLSTSISTTNYKLAIATAVFLSVTMCAAQDQAPPESQPAAPPQAQSVTLPAGTRFALVLTHPIQSRYIRRGDDIYAQVNSPVDSGNQVVIPPGTFVQGTVDKLEQHNGRAFLHLQSMAVTFPDGYVAPVNGPLTLESNEGYAVKDISGRRGLSALAMPLAGSGLGALIGHSIGTADSQVTTPFPPGCIGAPPFCTTTTTPVFGTKTKDTIIGAGIGGMIGGLATLPLILSSHAFFMDVGSPVEMTLDRPLTLQEDEVAKAIEHAAEHPYPPQPVAPRPVAPPPDMPVDHGTCYTPGTPGTPATVIAGTPGPDGIPGPPTVIPGTPPTPGAPYPCP